MGRLAELLAAAAMALLAHGAAAAQGEGVADEIGRLNNDSLLWGPYKSNLYFGVRPRLAQSLWTGLMWSRMDDYADLQNRFRYTCEQSAELQGYGWDEYDARTGGTQSIHDEGSMMDITTSFVKVPGGSHGGSWAARIKGTLRDDAPRDTKTMVLLYVAQEELGELAVEETGTKFGFEGDVTLRGSSAALGAYTLVVTGGKGAHPESDHVASAHRRSDTTVVRSVNLDPEHLWQAKVAVFQQLQESVKFVQENYDQDDLPPPWQTYRFDPMPGSGNAHMVQKVFEGSFEFDVIFSSGSAGQTLGSDNVTREIRATSRSFGERFASVFSFQAPYAADKYRRFGQSLFSSLLGGVGYFHGHQVIDRSYAEEYEEEGDGFWEDAAAARARGAQQFEGPYELFTAVPSRSFFPRGFLWDEGFHLALIADWDMDLTLDIVKSWYRTMDGDGWIPREQILGMEARSKVPPEFQIQYPHYANPPTLFLTIENFMERLRAANKSGGARKFRKGDPLYSAHLEDAALGEAFLRDIYPLLRRQYDWFRSTQRGDIKTYDREAFSTREAYRWRGRTETHCLTSGLDDYPRPQPPSPGELHVDLMSWVGLMAKSLLNIADALGMAEDVELLGRQLHAIERNLEDLHWSEEQGCFCDATIDDFEEHKLVCHRGYVSLFPFLVGLMKPGDDKVGRILDLMGDEEELFSRHGLRSLSKRSEFYGTEENYWRSPVWMPMNYMAVTQLYNVATQDGPFKERARDLYSRLRRNLVDTVFKSWEETGTAWEQYNPETGAGQRNQQFTGWTSLAVKLMAMEDLGVGHARDEL
ncbi:putative mannosyl-oligosaccharide glucosidase [Escovopsis weberi]|uniref:Mannosyl-oligosaccharide glucosidase n=1 Tax=Escovopsis weberi TaxID=150374 RepID=A0A0M8MXJ7_ESCWE|nr:putative mannosyl-oligosaccharide glucosidase [Escovopsis weberi]